MAISELTKRVAKRRRDEITSIIDRNDKRIAEHEALAQAIEIQNVALKAESDALKKDIPDPTPVPE